MICSFCMNEDPSTRIWREFKRCDSCRKIKPKGIYYCVNTKSYHSKIELPKPGSDTRLLVIDYHNVAYLFTPSQLLNILKNITIPIMILSYVGTTTITRIRTHNEMLEYKIPAWMCFYKKNMATPGTKGHFMGLLRDQGYQPILLDDDPDNISSAINSGCNAFLINTPDDVIFHINNLKFKNYNNADKMVYECYKNARQRQTYEFGLYAREKYNNLSYRTTIWEMIKSLENFIDLSDPDMSLPNIVHMYQTAERIRADGKPDWFILVGLIHDLGKCIYLKGCDEDGTSMSSQWAIVGDTFIINEELPRQVIYPELSVEFDKRYRYKDGCGLENCMISYGHDEYMYQILKQNNIPLPEQALYMVRYHSLYLWHRDECYKRLEDSKDREMKKWVIEFNMYDLYSKTEKNYTQEELKELNIYYKTLVDKYFTQSILI